MLPSNKINISWAVCSFFTILILLNVNIFALIRPRLWDFQLEASKKTEKAFSLKWMINNSKLWVATDFWPACPHPHCTHVCDFSKLLTAWTNQMGWRWTQLFFVILKLYSFNWNVTTDNWLIWFYTVLQKHVTQMTIFCHVWFNWRNVASIRI